MCVEHYKYTVDYNCIAPLLTTKIQFSQHPVSAREFIQLFVKLQHSIDYKSSDEIYCYKYPIYKKMLLPKIKQRVYHFNVQLENSFIVISDMHTYGYLHPV